MFSIELKFTADCLKFWFQKNHKIIELDVDEKEEFRRNNLLTKQALCCLCHFPIEPRAGTDGHNMCLKLNIFFWKIFTVKNRWSRWELKTLKLFSKIKQNIR